jgi:hypothetical protein
VFAEVFLDSYDVSLFSHATIRPEKNQVLVYWRTEASDLLLSPRFSPPLDVILLCWFLDELI